MSLIFICFDLFLFESNLRRNHLFELSSELDAPILDRAKKNLDSEIFPLGLSNFGRGAWFPFHKGQSILHTHVMNPLSSLACCSDPKKYISKLSLNRFVTH